MNTNKNQTKLFLLIPLLLFGAAAAFLWFVDAEYSISGKPALDMLLALALLNLLFYCWVRTRSAWSRQRQLTVVAVFCVPQLFLVSAVQLAGLHGNGRPVLAWRWSVPPADNFEPSSSGIGEAVELPAVGGWPQFRGPNRDGKLDARLTNWKTDSPEMMWRQPIGAGWASFAVAGQYCFTLEQRGDNECVVCYRVADGAQIWENSRPARFSEISGGEGPRATPAYSDGKLFALGATGILQCIDASNGNAVWEKNILDEVGAENRIFGMCGSPLVVDGKVIVCPGGEGSSMVALDVEDGSVVWQDGNASASYSSPVEMNLCGVRQVLNFNGEGLSAHELASGKVLWQLEWVSNKEEKNNVCQPIRLSADEVFLSSGYGMGCARIRIQKDAGEWSTSFVWKNKNLKSKFSSAVYDGRNIFGLDLGILVCLDSATGKPKWKQGRYAHGQFIMAGDFLIVQAEKGYVAQVMATADRFSETGRVRALRHRTWTHPVLADRILLLRNDREMSAWQLK